MIVIISATNRKGSNTKKVAEQYVSLAKNLKIEAKFLSLESLTSIQRDDNFTTIEKEYLIPATKFLVVSPEYNGSFSGIFKLMIDISDIKQVWHNKKVALVGVATGRAGNLRGMDHLTNIFNHMKMLVLPNKLPLSGVQNLITSNNVIEDETAVNLMQLQLIELNNL